jgi:Uma2 family endonuclease
MNGSVVQREHHRPDTVRGADIAFVSWERFPQQSPVGFPPLGPDLVVEVLSPGDRPGEDVLPEFSRPLASIL